MARVNKAHSRDVANTHIPARIKQMLILVGTILVGIMISWLLDSAA